MMDKDFFVMLNTQNGGMAPLLTEDEELACYATEDEAREAGAQNILGEAFGYEVFERGGGVSF